MNKNLATLYHIAEQDTRVIIGLMSGTSLDGLDIALTKIQGSGSNTRLELLAFESLEYSSAFRDEIRSVFSKETVYTEMLCAMNAKIGIAHAELVNKTLKKWKLKPEQINLIASHGQTVFHAPLGSPPPEGFTNSTLQIGDGDHIAMNTRIITISDFRQKHVAAGGEGAPLVIYGDYLLFGHSTENRVLLNIGGISNLTFLPAGRQVAGVFATDVGSGNTLMNQYMQAALSKPFDKDGELAADGEVNVALLAALFKHPFFEKVSPKTTGPELFNLSYLEGAQLQSGTTDLGNADVMATLSMFTARCIADTILQLSENYGELSLYVSGGGYLNKTLMNNLKTLLPGVAIDNTSVLGMNPEAKEAVLFALLANETVAGSPIEFPETSGAPAVCFGKVSFPD
ncbi:anhydro-N-acetylmuramic acid kinase [Albibacterium indicum]|uniref:anhydro-N-acetylmuramic acid kinase n=1 Tax=Albibacterium indicum TaxID=2292082 RepID=UPI000E4DF514|nr:anhydro-N-acetylmuramic acid kinase [Pedobacter indicus]